MNKECISTNLSAIRQQIAKAARQWSRAEEEITLIAVSKTQEKDAIEVALQAGQRHFGENRVQEAASKFPSLREGFPDLKLHLIGPLQTNKVKDAIGLADYIHSLDREKLAVALAQEMQRQRKRPSLFVQVNVGLEPQKAGIAPKDTPSFLRFCRKLDLPIIGLMCIPPAEEAPSPYFALLAKIAKENNLSQLSMGMSADFPEAIALGASFVRVGSAIFGARKKVELS